MAAPPRVGEEYIYEPADGKGHGASHKGQELTAEMTALDLAPGTHVVVHDIIEGGPNDQWPLLEWTDSVGTPRITSFDPDEFAGDFQPVG